MKKTLRTFLLIVGLSAPLLAQSASAPPAEPQVQDLMHFIHAVNRLEPTIAFYHDVFGLDATPRDFNNPAVAQLNNAPGLKLRNAMLNFPEGKFRFELTEFSNFDRKPGEALPTDPGAEGLILNVRGMDSVLEAIKKCGAPILTKGGKSVLIKTGNGLVRSMMVRDPDGYMVQIVEVPDSKATVPGIVQPGTATRVAVKDMESTLRFYRDWMGFALTGDMQFKHDRTQADLIGAPEKAEYREMSGNIPRSPARVEFYEWKGLTRTPFHLRVPDPGAPGFVMHVYHQNELLAKLKSEGVPVESMNHEPVQFGPTSRNVFVEDPNGLNLELVQIVPAAPKS